MLLWPVCIALAALVLVFAWRRSGLNLADCRQVAAIGAEFFLSFRAMQKVGPAVSMFASARLAPGSEPYEQLRRIAYKLVTKSKLYINGGFAILTGGGPGGMQASNQGAREAGGRSFGLTIRLPWEQSTNEFVEHEICFQHYFPRKVCLVRYPSYYIVGQGGFGTLDELFEVLTLQQCEHSPEAPVYLVNQQLAEALVQLVSTLYQQKLISLRDVQRLVLVGNIKKPEDLPMRCLSDEDAMIDEIIATHLAKTQEA